MKKMLIWGGVIVFLLVVVFWNRNTSDIVSIGNQIVQVEVVDTEALRNLGLSGRNSLEEGTGMLFVFSRADKHGFWMKDMNFPIDIIWINENKVISIEYSVSPDTYPKTFYPISDAQYVLEVPANFSLEHDIKIGSNFSIGH